MEQYMNMHEIDVMTINEADLYGVNARITRTNPVDDDVINLNLHIENYKLWIPDQWNVHKQARTIIYTKDHLNVQKVKTK